MADGTVVWTEVGLATATGTPAMLSSDGLMLSDTRGISASLNAWTLTFLDFRDKRPRKGQLVSLRILDDGPTLGLKDTNGFQAELGASESETALTGETHKTSAASLVMSDKNGTTLWRAP